MATAPRFPVPPFRLDQPSIAIGQGRAVIGGQRLGKRPKLGFLRLVLSGTVAVLQLDRGSPQRPRLRLGDPIKEFR